MKKRIFIAINLPEEIKTEIGKAIKKAEAIEPGVKWVNALNIHITLAFMGYLEEKEIAKITTIVKAVAKNQKKYILSLENAGVFPSLAAPQVFWIGTRENLNLINLQNVLKSRLQIGGFKTEERVFVPHLTIGRVKNKIKNVQKLLGLLKEVKFEHILVSSIDVMESILKKSGPEYKTIFKVNLKNM